MRGGRGQEGKKERGHEVSREVRARHPPLSSLLRLDSNFFPVAGTPPLNSTIHGSIGLIHCPCPGWEGITEIKLVECLYALPKGGIHYLSVVLSQFVRRHATKPFNFLLVLLLSGPTDRGGFGCPIRINFFFVFFFFVCVGSLSKSLQHTLSLFYVGFQKMGPSVRVVSIVSLLHAVFFILFFCSHF